MQIVSLKRPLVASDGTAIEPLEITCVIIHVGETMDVEIKADQAMD